MGRGLSDYNVLSTAGGILGGMFGGPAGAAAGSSLGSLAEGDDFGEAMMGGLMSFGVGTALQGLSGTAGSFTGAGDATAYATDALAEGATKGAFQEGLGTNMLAPQRDALTKQYLGTKAYEDALAKNLGQEGLTSNMFKKTGTGIFGDIGKGIETAGFGDFASRAIKNPKVYTGLGMAGLGLAGQMEPPALETPEKKTYAARAPNLTTGPARAQNAPSADYAYGYGPEFDYGFAEGGIVPKNDLLNRGAAALMDPSFENMNTLKNMINKTGAAPQRRSGGTPPMDRIADMGLNIRRVGPAPQQGGGLNPMGDLLSRSDLFKEIGPAPQRGGGGILNMAALAQANPDMFSRVTEDEDENEDRRFAGGGIVSGNRKYAMGDLIIAKGDNVAPITGPVASNLGKGLSVVNTLGQFGVPGIGSVVGAGVAGAQANAYQDDLARRGITTEYGNNVISGGEGMANSLTMGLIGNSPKEQYDRAMARALAISKEYPTNDPNPFNNPYGGGPATDNAGNELVFSSGSPQESVTTNNLAPLDGFEEDDTDDNQGPMIDLDAIANASGISPLSPGYDPYSNMDLDSTQENLDSLLAGQGSAYNTVAGYVSSLGESGYNDIDPAVQDAISGMRRDLATSDGGLTAVMSGEGLSPDQAWSNVSADAISDPGLGEEGMGSTWAQGGLVPGSMNEPQKRYFGIYKQGGPVRSYALGENVEAIQAEQVQQNPIVVEAVAAITGNHPEPEKAIMQFVNIYGEEALVALRDEIIAEASSEQRQASGLGALSGPGTGLSDDIPAEVQQGGLSEPAALSVGEQVVPADVVAMLGDGSTEAGSKRLDGMVDEVRMQKTGTKQQAGPLDTNKMTALMA